MNQKIFPATFLSLALPFLSHCRTTEEAKVLATTPAPRHAGALPSVANGDPWGGTNAQHWKPEAIYANGLSDFMNRLWQVKNVTDVLVSIPVSLIDSDVKPYGDLQSNARMVFDSSWKGSTVPFRAGLVKHSNGSEVIFEFSPEMKLTQTQMEIGYTDSHKTPHSITLTLTKNSDGWSTATWSSFPSDLPPSEITTSQNPEDSSALNVTFFARPTPNFDDWFPVTFKHPWTTVDKIMATVPTAYQAFTVGTSVPNPKNLVDPMSFAQKTANDPLPFDLAYNLGKKRAWPKDFAPQNADSYPACNVHGSFTKDDKPHDPTAVGRNWTWVADPDTQPAGAKTVPFKILYTCFEERRLKRPTGNDVDCANSTRTSEEDEGVPSGAGWHRIGNYAETLFNSLERVPLLVSAGFEKPAERLGLKSPTGSYAYGLSDVAIARWLWPQEAFLTATSETSTQGKSYSNFHWFLFHADREVCTLEWVHPKRPDDNKTAVF